MSADNVSTVFLRGESIFLRSLRQEDFGETMVGWINDRDVTRFLVRGTFPASLEEMQREYQNSIARRDEVQLAVCEAKSGRFLGLAGLHGLHPVCHHGEFRILLGAKDTWGKGYGTEALQLMCAYGFELLNLNKVWLGVNMGNTRAFNSYKKAGFAFEGELRDEVFRNGRYYNVARFSMLRGEYEKLKGTWKIAPLLAKQLAQ